MSEDPAARDDARDDEPLEGDIGPAPGVGTPRPAETADSAERLAQYEADRELRRRRTNAVAGRIAVVVAALFLTFLTYDSTRTAVEARSRGDDWLYPPAVMALICLGGLISLLTWALRRRRLGM